MFRKSISSSWTYVAIIARAGGMTHYMQEFTLPSNQTKYSNNNQDAMRYYCTNLNIRDSVEGCVAVEDYDMEPPRVGISIMLAADQRRERQKKFDDEIKAGKYMGVDSAKTEYTKYENLHLERDIHKLDKETDHIDRLFNDIFQSSEFQVKYNKMVQDLTLDIIERMLVTELGAILQNEYVKKSDL